MERYTVSLPETQEVSYKGWTILFLEKYTSSYHIVHESCDTAYGSYGYPKGSRSFGCMGCKAECPQYVLNYLMATKNLLCMTHV